MNIKDTREVESKEILSQAIHHRAEVRQKSITISIVEIRKRAVAVHPPLPNYQARYHLSSNPNKQRIELETTARKEVEIVGDREMITMIMPISRHQREMKTLLHM